ncbi:MAG TPA: hypothetical protein DCR58_02085 [Idiomarina baltica]|uniref:SprT-like domain-containing protein n=2 Tax=Alteromonadales TaxID=135622 RepID=A0A358DYI5_9ALTE|nr:hypothetical protein [Alteromonas australica]HAR55556.1 hypothetical protein [Idiomarina baltica]HBU51339.1 hypothetical protein [Alteromonas australica]|tara:strand:- start:7494 stop:8036 length:543 start_codon:yes stop_codon:yes gene_type:complete
MSSIDHTLIHATFNECIAHAKRCYPCATWRVIPRSIVVSTSIKSKYATVNADGEVRVNRAFIGTQSIDKLKETVLHEIAHCIVGLENGHNRYFREVFSALASHINVRDDEVEDIKSNNGYPLRLVAYTKDEALDLGGAFRRAKKYMEYAPTDSRFLSVRGVKVERFAYLPYSENWKTHKK